MLRWAVVGALLIGASASVFALTGQDHPEPGEEMAKVAVSFVPAEGVRSVPRSFSADAPLFAPDGNLARLPRHNATELAHAGNAATVTDEAEGTRPELVGTPQSDTEHADKRVTIAAEPELVYEGVKAAVVDTITGGRIIRTASAAPSAGESTHARTQAVATPAASGGMTLPRPRAKAPATDRLPDSQERLTRSLQKALARVGCYDGALDGLWGKRSQSAMRRFTSRIDAALPVSEPDGTLLLLVQRFEGRACGQGCSGAFDIGDEQCVRQLVASDESGGPADGENEAVRVQRGASRNASAARAARVRILRLKARERARARRIAKRRAMKRWRRHRSSLGWKHNIRAKKRWFRRQQHRTWRQRALGGQRR